MPKNYKHVKETAQFVASIYSHEEYFRPFGVPAKHDECKAANEIVESISNLESKTYENAMAVLEAAKKKRHYGPRYAADRILRNL